MEQGGLTKHLNAKHRLVSSQSSEAALTKVPPSAPTKAQMGGVLDDIDVMMISGDTHTEKVQWFLLVHSSEQILIECVLAGD